MHQGITAAGIVAVDEDHPEDVEPPIGWCCPNVVDERHLALLWQIFEGLEIFGIPEKRIA